MPEGKGVKTDLVSRIIANVKGGDEKNVTEFFVKVKKNLNRDIENLKLNIKTSKAKHEQKLSDLNDNLEDARSNKEEVLLSVDLEAIKTSAGRTSYVDVYSDNIDRAEAKIDDAEDAIKDAETKQKAKIEDLNDQIKAKQALLDLLSK